MLLSIPLMFVLIGIPTFFGFTIRSLVDGVVVLAGRPVDGRGRPLRP